MRDAFVRALTEVAGRDDRVVFLTGDLGFRLFDDFAARFPGRFWNVGVAEATMASVAAGLALEGKKPFVYSIVPFVTMRCFEQVRNDICYHEADVVLVGVGGGYAYGLNGPTHHGVEDIALMRALPNMKVVCPADPLEASAAVHALARERGPAYLRLGRAGEPRIHETPPDFRLGKALVLREGSDLALLSCGPIAAVGLEAAERLAGAGVSVRVVSMPTVKPLDTECVLEAAERFRAVATLEEHTTLGGFGSAVAEVLAEAGIRIPFRRFGTADRFCSLCGDQTTLRRANGLDAETLSTALLELLR